MPARLLSVPARRLVVSGAVLAFGVVATVPAAHARPTDQNPDGRPATHGATTNSAVAGLGHDALTVTPHTTPQAAVRRATRPTLVAGAAQGAPVLTRSSTVHVEWPTAIVLDDNATATGRITTTTAQTLWLEQRYADGWRQVASTRTTPTGAFALTIPTGWLYTMPTRVQVPETGLISDTTRVRVRPGYTPQGRATAWAPLEAKTWFRWDPCEPITYRINATHGPAHSIKAVRAAVAAIADATGLRFAYAGTTTAIPWARKGHRSTHPGTQLIVAFAYQRQVSVDISGETIARGGILKALWERDANDRRVARIEQGGVAFDAASPYDYPDTVHVMLHELGHVVGLGHVRDNRQRMAGTAAAYRPTTEWGAGDLTGLNNVGAQQGCIAAS